MWGDEEIESGIESELTEAYISTAVVQTRHRQAPSRNRPGTDTVMVQ